MTKAFASRLENALERYVPPADLGVPRRPFDVFRDEEDFTGGDYYQSLDRHLQDSAKLIVICWPHARFLPCLRRCLFSNFARWNEMASCTASCITRYRRRWSTA